ncbi:MAG: DnaJ domain-containing protein [Deltaproteobacteria bacterium]|nr:DnaJ domain-containing protein [Deltaproteobacteria bacterium]
MSASSNDSDQPAQPKEPVSPVTPDLEPDSSPLQSGHFADVPLPRLLLDLYRSSFNGRLELSRDKTTKQIVFQKGAPVVSESNLPNETLGVQLMDAGQLSQADHEKISSYMRLKKCREGVALLALKLIEPKQLFEALKEQVRRRVIEAFAWSKGAFRLLPEESGKSEIQPFRNDPFLLVRDGLCAHWTPDQILSALMTQMESYAHPTSKLDGARKRLGGDPQIDALLDAIDGRRMLGEAIGSGFNSPPLLATAWVLINARLIELQDTPIVDEADQSQEFVPADIEIEIESAPSAAQTGPDSRPTLDADPRSAGTAAGTKNKAAEIMRKEVLERHESLDDLTFYDLLGVPSDATPAAIRKAYFAAAKRYHPDGLTRLGLNDIKDEANTVFSHIAEANEILSDAEKRRSYDAAINDEGPEVDVNLLAQAETLYRKSEILSRMGDFRGALEFLRPCVELWPEECAYQSALGWALFKQPQSELESAREHLERALELDADDPVTHTRLGVLLKELGESERAAELLARAKMLES